MVYVFTGLRHFVRCFAGVRVHYSNPSLAIMIILKMPIALEILKDKAGLGIHRYIKKTKKRPARIGKKGE